MFQFSDKTNKQFDSKETKNEKQTFQIASIRIIYFKNYKNIAKKINSDCYDFCGSRAFLFNHLSEYIF